MQNLAYQWPFCERLRKEKDDFHVLNIFEKIAITAKLLKIFDIYFFCYLSTNEKIAITHLLYAMELQTMYHLIAKDKIAEQHLLGKYNSFGVTKA